MIHTGHKILTVNVSNIVCKSVTNVANVKLQGYTDKCNTYLHVGNKIIPK